MLYTTLRHEMDHTYLDNDEKINNITSTFVASTQVTHPRMFD